MISYFIFLFVLSGAAFSWILVFFGKKDLNQVINLYAALMLSIFALFALCSSYFNPYYNFSIPVKYTYTTTTEMIEVRDEKGNKFQSFLKKDFDLWSKKLPGILTIEYNIFHCPINYKFSIKTNES